MTLLAAWRDDLPLLVIAHPDEETLIKSFRNLPKTVVTVPSELDVTQVVWARSVLVTEGALDDVRGRAA